jgi:UDP-2,4-diacetamido-2,4,6-trideoxy-beta-L-altropyranose hydrolase
MQNIERVAIRVDASPAMGMGHLTRCLSLANELARSGVKVFFLMRSHAAAFVALVEAEGHAVLLLSDSDGGVGETRETGSGSTWLSTTWWRDAEQTQDMLDQIDRVDWLIVDHYGLDARWERLLRQRSLRVLVIDDLADRPHDCDLLLDQNLVLDMETRYRNCVPVNCRPLLGPRYALLRPEFQEARKSMTGRDGKIHRVFVCYGGSDPSNETEKTLAAIKKLSAFSLDVDVVIGLGNPHAYQVASLCLELPGAQMHRNANNVAELMKRADLAMGAGGGMNWERCCLGLPTIAVDIAENQINGLTALAKAGALLHLGSAASVTQDRIESAIRSLVSDPARTRSMGEAASALVDGQGTSRVRAALDA